jgi:glycosyltransferase involved in cell wall biosynthesis
VRILSVTPYAPPHVGGLETLVDSLASRLAARGHDVTVVASPAGLADGLGSGPPPASYRIAYVPAAYKFLQRRVGVPYPLFGPALIRLLRREIPNADVVHAHGFLFQSTLAALALARRLAHRPATVLTEHVGHVPYANRVLDRAEAAAIGTLGRWSARLADAVAVYNASVYETIARIAPETRLEWIDTGIDTDFFRPPAADERASLRGQFAWDERPRVLFGGRAVAKKGLDVALEAARAGDGAFVLVVVGAIEAPPGAPNVERLGLLSRERMAQAFRAADALLMPSRGEGLPVTIQEALSSALPVVATDDPGYRDSLAGFGAAARLMPVDGAAMGRALVEVVSDPGARSSAEAAVDLARERFSLDAYALAHERLYGELLAARSDGDGSGGESRSRVLEGAR